MVIDDSLGVIDEAQMLLKNLRVMSQKTPLIDPVDCARDGLDTDTSNPMSTVDGSKP